MIDGRFIISRPGEVIVLYDKRHRVFIELDNRNPGEYRLPKGYEWSQKTKEQLVKEGYRQDASFDLIKV